MYQYFKIRIYIYIYIYVYAYIFIKHLNHLLGTLQKQNIGRKVGSRLFHSMVYIYINIFICICIDFLLIKEIFFTNLVEI